MGVENKKEDKVIEIPVVVKIRISEIEEMASKLIEEKLANEIAEGVYNSIASKIKDAVKEARQEQD